MANDNQRAQYLGLREGYLILRKSLNDERWWHGAETERVRMLMARRNDLRAVLEPLAKSLNRTDWPPTPWEK